jgi:hypothetical protein
MRSISRPAARLIRQAVGVREGLKLAINAGDMLLYPTGACLVKLENKLRAAAFKSQPFEKDPVELEKLRMRPVNFVMGGTLKTAQTGFLVFEVGHGVFFQGLKDARKQIDLFGAGIGYAGKQLQTVDIRD